ncbi:MAG TPA: hypothetical protein VFH06_04655 [Candidatus Saccharimonadales bacterium]|nr:hypothetical protein [Candidatus Saccharimonadales bacterium]
MVATVTLPSADELFSRLSQVNNDTHYVKFVYPYVCTSLSGNCKSGFEVMETLSHSITSSATIHRSMEVLDAMMLSLQKFAEDLLVNDLAALQPDALEFLARLYQCRD